MVIRVLHISETMARAGQETLIMNWMRHIDRDTVAFDFVVQAREEGDYCDEIESFGGHVHVLPSIKRNPIGRLASLRRLLADGDYDVVHRHSDKSIEGVDLIAAWTAGVRARVYHGHSDQSAYSGVHKLFRPLTNALATHKLACSDGAARWVFGRRPAYRGEVTLIANGVDVTSFSYDEAARRDLRAELGLGNRFVVGHVGRFCEAKNHGFLLDVFAKVKAARPDAMLVLAGEGPLREQIELMAERLGVRDAVVFAGSRGDVNRLCSALDVFIFPSLYEGLPLAPLEAQSNGLPVLMADTISDQAHIGAESARFSLAESPSAWAHAALSARRDPAGSSQVRAAGFDTRATTELLAGYYAAALSRGVAG